MNIITLNIHTLDSFTPVCLGAPTVHTPVKKNQKKTDQTPGSILVSKLKQIQCSF